MPSGPEATGTTADPKAIAEKRESGLQPPPLVSRLAGPLAGLAAGVLVIVLAQTIELPSIEGQFSPRWWPQMAGAGVILFSFAAVVQGFPERPVLDELDNRQPGGIRRILLSLSAVIAYVVMWHWLDFRAVTILLTAALVAIGGGRGWRGLVLFPAVVTTVLWLLFSVLLRVPV